LSCSYLSAASIHLDVKGILQTTAKDDTPSLSSDANLSALVQLGALRLDTDRSFLSLIDGKYQYIIAEATRTHSLVQNGVYAREGDQLYLGVKQLDISWGVCPNTMSVFTDETGSAIIKEKNVEADKTRYIIRDFHADPHYIKCPYVQGFPYMRTYAEVPLTSPLGYVIGSYCVVDNRVRDFDNSTVQVLTEIADRIMAHLELIRTKEFRMRSEQLIRGLGTFMERESSYPKEEDTESSKASEPNTSISMPIREKGSSIAPILADPRPVSEFHSSDSSIEIQPSFQSSNAEASPNDLTPLSSPIQPSEENPFEQQELTPEHAALREPVLSLTVRKVLAGAAALIAEAMNVDGVAFLDAVTHGFASRSIPENQHEPFLENEDGEFDQLDDDDSAKCTSLARAMRYQPDGVVLAAGKSPTDTEVSTSPLSESILQRLIRRYPRGHIFSADEFGPIDDRFCPGTNVGAARVQRSRRKGSVYSLDIAELFRLRPEARYIIFLPLWHLQRECWFLATLAWTTNPAQSFDNDDLTYLSAFGNSIMTEISRFETLAVSGAKSDFISSVSHELRSPLHGILASTELLREALGSNSMQLNMVDMIESCGNTLLDTMNHLLDFAKINNLTRNQSKHDKIADAHSDRGELSVSSSADVSNLVQEVVESVYLGHISKYGASSTSTEVTLAGQDHSVLVTMNIESRKNWTFNVQVGAWKRIVMNIFGNALKYTRAGQITVTLRIINEVDDSGAYAPLVYFSVRDTGIGMSPDYLKYHLFTPFAQENSLSPGAGLGLSIVKQIVNSLEGKLDVKSALGAGTLVTVLIPAKLGTAGHLQTFKPYSPSEYFTGKSICFVPPEDYTTAATEYKLHRLDAARKAVDKISKSWLGMNEITFAKDSLPNKAPDFCFLDASILDDSTDLISTLPQWALLRRSRTTLVLLCYGLHDGRRLDIPAICLRQPFGPKKLFSTLNNSQSMILHNDISSIRPIPIENGVPPQKEGDIRETQDPNPNTKPSASLITSSKLNNITTPKRHILIVEDNPINMKLLSTQIQRLGHTFNTAMNGLEAIHVFKASKVPFDFVFMDISMPIMNGFEATQEIRSYENSISSENPATIVALTGLGSNLSKQEAFSSGVNVFLTKPVSLKEVRRLLDAHD